jgi:hypothetical protein
MTAVPKASSRQQLAATIEDFLARTGMSPTPFGLMAARDDKLLWRIRNAKYGISMDKADRIYAFMDTYDRSVATGGTPGLALEKAKAAAADPFEQADVNGHRRHSEKPNGHQKRSGHSRKKAEAEAPVN